MIHTESFREASPIKQVHCQPVTRLMGTDTTISKTKAVLLTGHLAFCPGPWRWLRLPWFTCTVLLGSTLHIPFFLAQSSQVIQEGVVITPILQMRKLRLGGLKTAQDLNEQEARSGLVLRRCCHGHGVAARRRWVPSTGRDRHCEARE